MPQSPKNSAVAAALQAALVSAGCTLAVDGIVGPATRHAVAAVDPARQAREWQEWLAQWVCAPLRVDGVWGPRSQYAWDALIGLLNPLVWGCAPAWVGGRASHYGGPDDPNDRYLGQAYLPDPREIVPSSGGVPVSPATYYQQVPAWVREVLDPAMGSAREWPQTTDDLGRRRAAGVSYYVRGLYCALRITSPLTRLARQGRVYADVISVREPSRVVSCRVIDYGPHPRVWASIDLSPYVYRELGLEWGRDRVIWRVRVSD